MTTNPPPLPPRSYLQSETSTDDGISQDPSSSASTPVSDTNPFFKDILNKTDNTKNQDQDQYPESPIDKTVEYFNNFQNLYDNLYPHCETFSKADLFIYVMKNSEIVYKAVAFKKESLIACESDYYNKVFKNEASDLIDFGKPSNALMVHPQLNKPISELEIPAVNP